MVWPSLTRNSAGASASRSWETATWSVHPSTVTAPVSVSRVNVGAERWQWTGRLGGLGAAGAPGTPGLRAPLRIGGATKARTGSCWGPSLPSRCGLGRRPEAATCYTPLRLRRQAWRPPAAHGSPRLVPIPVPARAHRGPAWLTRGPAAPRLAPDAYPGTWRVDLQQDLHHDVPRVLVALARIQRAGHHLQPQGVATLGWDEQAQAREERPELLVRLCGCDGAGHDCLLLRI